MFSHFFIVPPKIVIETFIATIYFHRLGKLREDFLLRLRRSNLKIVQLSRHARVWSLFTKAIFSDDSTLSEGTSLPVSQNCLLATTAKKLKYSIKDSCSGNCNLATYTEEILNGILHVLCSMEHLYHSNYFFKLHSNLTSLLWFSIG